MCLAIIAGCSTLKVGNILIDLSGYVPAANGSEAQISLQYTNENTFPIALGETVCKLYLNNEYVGKATQSDPVGIPQLNGASRTATLQIENPAVIQKILSSSATMVSYRIESTIRLQVSEENSRITTSSVGQFNVGYLRAAPASGKNN